MKKTRTGAIHTTLRWLKSTLVRLLLDFFLKVILFLRLIMPKPSSTIVLSSLECTPSHIHPADQPLQPVP